MQPIPCENLALANGGVVGSLIGTAFNVWAGTSKIDDIDDTKQMADFARAERQDKAHEADVLRFALENETWRKVR